MMERSATCDHCMTTVTHHSCPRTLCSVKQDRITSDHEIQTRAANYWQHLFAKERYGHLYSCYLATRTVLVLV